MQFSKDKSKEKKITGSRGVRSSFGEGEGGNSTPLVDILLRSRPRPRRSRRWFCSVEIDVTELRRLSLHSDITELRRFSLLSDITELRRRIGDTRPELRILVPPELADWFCFDTFWDSRGLRKNSFLRSLYWDPASDLAKEVPSRTTKSGVSRSSPLLSDKSSPGSRRCGTSRLSTGVDVRRCSSSTKVSIIKSRNLYHSLTLRGKSYFLIRLFL